MVITESAIYPSNIPVTDPELQIRGGRHRNPEIRGGGAGLPKIFLPPFGPHFGRKIRGVRPPGPLPWISHCIPCMLKKDLTQFMIQSLS